MNIRTTAEISAQTFTNNNKEWANIKWVRLEDVLLDLKSWLQANDYDELKQCVSNFINELES